MFSCYICSMRTYEDIAQDIQQAEADLAFALAQGDGYAEDAAAARIAALQAEREEAHAARG